MIIQMNTREFQEFRKFIGTLKNPKVNKTFNEVFSNEPTGGVKGFVNPLNNDIIIDIPESISYEVMKVFVNHGPKLSTMIKTKPSITNAPSWLSWLKSIANDISRVITKR